MRILKIRLKNINSLRGEHEIDFERSPLREAGLFGIVGATGSGKSTLLDSITLALYGRVPRIGQVTKTAMDKGGVILTKHEKDCYAEVTYSCKKGVFTSRWSVGKTRNDTFRDVEMKVFNAEGDLLTEKLSTAPDTNIGNIGLDYDQFVKSILLCQGDFAKFLQSGKNERAQLLEKITGTHQFRKIGKKAFREFNHRKALLGAKMQLISDLSKNIMSEEDRQQLESAIFQLTEQIAALEKKLDEAKVKLGQKSRLRQLRSRIEEQERRKLQADKLLQEFNARYADVLMHYDRLYVYKDQLSEHAKLDASIADLDRKIEAFSVQVREHDAAIDKLVLELRGWVGEEVSASDYIQHLRAFRDRVRDKKSKLEEQKRNLKSCYERLKPLLDLPGFKDEASYFKPKAGNDHLLRNLRARKDNEAGAYQNAIATYGFEETGLDALRDKISSVITDMGQLKLEVRSYIQLLGQIRQLGQKITEWENSLNAFDLALMKRDMEQARDAYEKWEHERNQLLRAEKLDELRKSLKDGEPCPLCGSEHHPYLHSFAAELLQSADELERAKKLFDQRKKTHDDAVLSYSQISVSLEREKQHLSALQAEQDRIGKVVELLKDRLGIGKVQSEERVDELIEEQKKKLEVLEGCIRYRQWVPTALQMEKEVQVYDSLYAELETLNVELARMYSGQDLEADCKQREDAMTQRQGSRRVALEQQKVAVEQRQRDAERLLTMGGSLEAALAGAGYASIIEARGLLIAEAEQKKLVEEKGRIGQELLGSKEQLEQLASQWKDEAAGDDESIVLEQQQVVVNELDRTLREARDLLKGKHGSLQADNKSREQLGAYEEEKKVLTEALRPWEMLSRLIGDAMGNRFNNMAQELTLQHLLILANRRMDKLHSRYKLLMPEKMEDDDLRVEDAYMGNEVRTVRSLSGGETFVLSLALALGLSDLASRDIRIDSLFVDEGFGSLDPDTLEEAMSTLEQLQDESNKMVGIISHVESLKERIYTQIRLEKSNNGFSTLSIFPETVSTDEAE